MTLPPISIVVHELGSNALGRALLLADLLRTETRVEILGVSRDATVWQPARGLDAKGITLHEGPTVRHVRDLPRARQWLRDTCSGDIVLVSKAMPTSLGLALDAHLDRPLVLDVDDWEYGLAQGHQPRVSHALTLAVGPLLRHRPNHASRIRRTEQQVASVAHRLVSNTWLQKRFGGELLYHVRDPEALDPTRIDATSRRRDLGIDTDARLWVGYVGTHRPHKGLADLVTAVARSAADVGLLLLGIDAQDPTAQTVLTQAEEQLGSRLRVAAPFPLDQLGEHVCSADVLAIPSRSGPAARGQIPAKLFDAMALARPIVATAVNDIPNILAGCGQVVPPDHPDALAAAIDAYAQDPGLRESHGAAARAKLIQTYSYSVGRQALTGVLGNVLSTTSAE